MDCGALTPIMVITGNGTPHNPRNAFTVPKELLLQRSGLFRDIWARQPSLAACNLPRLFTGHFGLYISFLTGTQKDLVAVARSQADRRYPQVKNEVLPEVKLESASSPASVATHPGDIASASPEQHVESTDQEPQPSENILLHRTHMLHALATIWFSAYSFKDVTYCNAVIDAILMLPNLGPCAMRCITEWHTSAPSSVEIAQHLEGDTPVLRLLVDCVAATMTPEEEHQNLLEHTWSFDFGAKLTMRICHAVNQGIEVKVPRFEDRSRYYFT